MPDPDALAGRCPLGYPVVDPAGLAAHPVAEYVTLGRRWLAILDADKRVRSVTVAGSVACGTADQFSDLDLAVVVVGSGLLAFVKDVGWLAEQVAPAFLVRLKQAGTTTVCSVLTKQMHRVDLLISEGPGELPPLDRRAALGHDLHEFLRVLALYPTVATRGEWLAAMDGAWLLRAILIRIALADSGLPPASTRRLNAQLQSCYRSRLEQLPSLSASPGEIAAFTAAAAAEFFALAPPVCRRLKVEWPGEFATATAAIVHPYLGSPTLEAVNVAP